jgi:site-specific DNA-methyltransferase (adenine-specific)
VILDDVASEMLDKMSGERKSGKMMPTRTTAGVNGRNTYGKDAAGGFVTMETYGDSGGASRFFYCAKSSRRERNAGLEGMPERTRDDWDNPSRMVGSSAAKARAAGGGGIDGVRPAANHHPTVKPIALMRWLCRLVTPPGGLILDPFMGSGSTGCAAVLEGFDFIGIEADEEYATIARARIAHWSGLAQGPQPQPRLRSVPPSSGSDGKAFQGSLWNDSSSSDTERCDALAGD